MIYDLAGQGGPSGISAGVSGRTPVAKLCGETLDRKKTQFIIWSN